MAINNVDDQPIEATENAYVSSAPKDTKPETKSGVSLSVDPALASARFRKDDLVHKPVFANGMRSKGVYTIYKSRFNAQGRFVEYQLKNVYTDKVDGSWTRERDLKPGS